MQAARLILLLLVLAQTATAQNRYTDSLYHLVKEGHTGNRDKVMLLSELANIVRYYDKPEALQLAEQAVTLANKEKDVVSQVYAYESRSAVHLIMDEIAKAHKDTDSSLWYAEKSNDAKALSWAWYRKGRELDFENRQQEAVTAQLKALQYIKEKGYRKEEASIYYALYGIFATWEDIDNEGKYALLALSTAQESGNPNNLCESWQAVGTAASDRYNKAKDKDKVLLDSALAAYKMAIAVYLEHEDRMTMSQLMSIPCINIADAYNRYFPPSSAVTDSIRRYAALALNSAVKGNDQRLQAASFGILNEDAKRNGNYELAETYLLQALSLMVAKSNPDYYIRSNIYRDLAELAERRKDHAQALKYQKSYIADYQKIFDAEQNSAGKKLEAQYQAKEKEQEIKFLKESEKLHRRQKYLYAGIGIALLAGLLFMFRSYHFRLRYSLQSRQLLEKEKEEARLLAKLKEEENLLLETEKQNAELYARLQEEQAKLKTEEAARLQAEQEVILAQKEVLQKEVLAGSLHVEQKNKILQSLKNRVYESYGRDIKSTELNKLLHQQDRLDNDFEDLKTDLKELHPDFYKKLQQKADNKLTDLDLKYCAYIFLKRNTKEMASLMGVEPKSIRMSKYRLKQKLGLDKEEQLEAFVRGLV